VELISSFHNTVPIIAINNKDKTLCVLEVMPPKRSDLVLTPDIPNSEANVLVLNSFNVEPCMAKVTIKSERSKIQK
jgi:hypothetical protein